MTFKRLDKQRHRDAGNENAWPDCPAATEKSGEIIATLLQDSYDWAFDPVI